MPRHYFAACTLGLEEVLESELGQLGAQWLEKRRGGVRFVGERELGYAACLWLRSGIHVQEQIAQSRVLDGDQLYHWVRSMDWSAYMACEQTLAVDAAVKGERFTHSLYAALRVKDAIVDQFRDRQGSRPNVDVAEPDLPLKLVISDDQAILYRVLSGSSLHKRGYREALVRTPLNESIAAGLLLLSDWDRKTPLVDPMCGSGTFLIEAAWIAGDVAPGLRRVFPFERWPDFERAAWERLYEQAEARAHPPAGPFVGADRHPGAVAIARRTVQSLGLAASVRIEQADARNFKPPHPPKFVVTNPPYGERLGEGDELLDSWRDLGEFLRRCPGATAWVLSGNADLTRHMRLRTSRKLLVRNGPIECRWLRYEVNELGLGAAAGSSGG